jgi:cytochrome c oxidase assembly protein subunit 15
MSNKRSIFQEVDGEAKDAAVAQTGLIDKGSGFGARTAVRFWLFVLMALVILMIEVGGLTRLTDSGLSITEWRPVTGAVPPLSAAVWDSEFAKYQNIPEYQLQNEGMSLSEFKVIYWWEWGHRQLGRVIGLVWALGFVFFLVTRNIPTGWTGRLLVIGVLGGFQGAVGWWMVASGLTGSMVDVASYRLATHLGIAFVILGFITWYALALGRSEGDLLKQRRARENRVYTFSTSLIGLGFLQILFGALVAGIDAGSSYTDWPLMAGGFLPPDPLTMEPLWRNFFEDPGLVQFMHRVTGYLLFGLGVFLWWTTRHAGNNIVKSAFKIVLGFMTLQVVLGVITVIHAAPWYFAIVHQLGAVLLWMAIIRARFLVGFPPSQNLRN